MKFLITKIQFDEDGLWFADFQDKKTNFIIEVDNYDDIKPYEKDYVIQEMFDLD